MATGMIKEMRRTLFLLGLFFAASVNGAVTLEWVNVGDAGNAADGTGYGAVAYEYRIMKYEVTNAQYAEFLNAVAATDTNALYNTNMASNALGGINRSGISGSYSYSVKSGYENMPVVYVSHLDAQRFANWIHNGQGSGSTETGAYTVAVMASPLATSVPQCGYRRRTSGTKPPTTIHPPRGRWQMTTGSTPPGATAHHLQRHHLAL